MDIVLRRRGKGLEVVACGLSHGETCQYLLDAARTGMRRGLHRGVAEGCGLPADTAASDLLEALEERLYQVDDLVGLWVPVSSLDKVCVEPGEDEQE